MAYEKIENLDQYVTLISDYADWSVERGLPELSVGPSSVTYSKEHVKTQIVAFKLEATPENSIRTITLELITALNAKLFTEKSLKDMMCLSMALITKDKGRVFQEASEDYYTIAPGEPDSTTPIPYTVGDITTSRDVVSSALGRESTSAQPQETNMKEFIDNDKNIIFSGPYWAASFLRLMNKEPESWRRAMGAIQTQFGTFYGATSPFITRYVPLLAHAQQVRVAMDSFRRVSRAMIAVAATTEQFSTVNSKEHHMFIYFAGQHLSFAGMHAYPLITMMLHKMRGIPPAHVLSLLTTETTREALKLYYRIATTADAPAGLERNKRDFMWKYSRLVNEGYFLALQTKRNTELVYGLVLLAKKMGMVGSNEWADPEKMAALAGKRELREEAMEFCNAVYTLYKAQIAVGPNATGTDRYMAARRGIRLRAPVVTTETEKRRVEEPAAMHVDEGDTGEPAAKKLRNAEAEADNLNAA